MSPYERLFGTAHAFDHPVTRWVTAVVIVVLAVWPLMILFLGKTGRITEGRRDRLWWRWRSWMVMAPLLLGSVLLGAAWTILAVGLLSLLCYREYARATGLFREKGISLTIVLGILFATAATLDNWYGLFMALTPLTIIVILTVALLADRPHGYIQRTALGVLGFVLFGHGLGHLGFLANDENFRPLILMVLLAAEMTGLFTYLVGRTLGHVPLCPNTSPKATVAGSIGGLVLTTILVVVAGRSVFQGTELANWHHLMLLGMMISVVGQLGTLSFASIKQDLGIKDFDVTIPGHGGLLDRFDRIVPIAAVVFHYVNYFVGVGVGQQTRIWTTFG